MVKSNTLTEKVVSAAAAAVGSIVMNLSALTIQTGQPLSITGQVLDTNANLFSGATVYLFINGVNKGSAVSGTNGGYSFTATFSSAGSYQIWVSDNTSGT